MTNLFEKAVVFTDIHFGRKSNDIKSNQDNIDFINWMIVEAKKLNAETAIFMGDWHDNRYSIHLTTLNFTSKAINLLSKNFKQVFLITGNHDLAYKDRRDIHGLVLGKNLNNVKVIDDIIEIDNVALVPWVLTNEVEKIKNLKSKYVFGHFEFGGFYMNNKTKLPDEHGILKLSDLSFADYVFSGHFHKRQQKNNIIYIGNVMPFDFSDAGDDSRGFMFLEWGKEPVFYDWNESPKFYDILLSDFLSNKEKYLIEKISIKATLDIELSWDSIQFIRECMLLHYPIRRFDISFANFGSQTQDIVLENTSSLDETVMNGIDSLDGNIDKDLLKQIYGMLI